MPLQAHHKRHNLSQKLTLTPLFQTPCYMPLLDEEVSIHLCHGLQSLRAARAWWLHPKAWSSARNLLSTRNQPRECFLKPSGRPLLFRVFCCEQPESEHDDYDDCPERLCNSSHGIAFFAGVMMFLCYAVAMVWSKF